MSPLKDHSISPRITAFPQGQSHPSWSSASPQDPAFPQDDSIPLGPRSISRGPSISPRITASPRHQSHLPQASASPRTSGAGRWLGSSSAPPTPPAPAGTHRPIPATCGGIGEPLSGQVLAGQQVPGPGAGAGRVPAGTAGQGSDARARRGGQAEGWGCVGTLPQETSRIYWATH